MVAALLGDKATMPCAGLRTAMWYTDIHANKMPIKRRGVRRGGGKKEEGKEEEGEGRKEEKGGRRKEEGEGGGEGGGEGRKEEGEGGEKENGPASYLSSGNKVTLPFTKALFLGDV